MSSRILLATVAAIGLAVPALAQDQAKPLDTEQKTTEQLGQTQTPLPEQSGDRGDTAGQHQQGAEPSEPGQPPATAEEQPAEQPAQQEVVEEEAAPPAEMEFIQVQDEAQFLADEEVIGKDVVNLMDEEVGTITDLVMDQDQKLVGVVLSVGGFLGIGDKWVAVPVDQIDFPTDEEPARLRLAVTEEQLKNAPDFVTRQEVEAEEAAEQAEQQALQQQVPSPPATDQ